MDTNEKALTQAQQRAIVALLTTKTHDEAAQQAGIASRTMRAYLALPHFRDALKAAQSEAFQDALATLGQIVGKAIATLERNLDCGKPSVEVRAASAVLEHSIKDAELQRLTRRIQDLETAAANGGSPNVR
jgi:phage host-nuclease inhibitor protein Gam